MQTNGAEIATIIIHSCTGCSIELKGGFGPGECPGLTDSVPNIIAIVGVIESLREVVVMDFKLVVEL